MCHLTSAVLHGNGREHRLRVDIALAQIPLLREKHLADMCGLCGDLAFDHVRTGRAGRVAHARKVRYERVKIRVLRKGSCLHFRKQCKRLIRKRRRLIDRRPSLSEQLKLRVVRRADLLGLLTDALRIQFIKRVFAVQPVSVNPDDRAALCCHCPAFNRPHMLRHADGKSARIRRQNADIGVSPGQDIDQLFQRIADFIQIR